MGQIIYKKMSLFDAPEGSILVHASNATSGWGAGIAKEFKKLYPKTAEAYKDLTETYNKGGLVGKFLLWDNLNEKHRVGTLVTSKDKGKKVDGPATILMHTEKALEEMAGYLDEENPSDTIYSNKFNSGLFKVPWEKTEALLKEFVKDRDVEWIICDPGTEK